MSSAPSFLLLCSTGRAGSTLTMRVLSQHRQLMVRDRFPYETRFRQYAEAAGLNGATALSMEPQAHGPVAYPPCGGDDSDAVAWVRREGPGKSPSADAARAFYAYLAASQGKRDYRWIAEKAIGMRLATHLLETEAGTRALFLFRDPRDVFYSMKAFNRKAPYSSGFGEEQGDEGMFRSIVFSWRRFAQLKQTFKDRIYRIHYEPLSAGRPAYYKRLFGWLEVQDDLPYVRQMLKQALQRDQLTEQHSTTASAEASLGRWKGEASEADRALFARFTKDIVAMGYEA